MYVAYGPRGRFRNQVVPENLTWSQLDHIIARVWRPSGPSRAPWNIIARLCVCVSVCVCVCLFAP